MSGEGHAHSGGVLGSPARNRLLRKDLRTGPPRRCNPFRATRDDPRAGWLREASSTSNALQNGSKSHRERAIRRRICSPLTREKPKKAGPRGHLRAARLSKSLVASFGNYLATIGLLGRSSGIWASSQLPQTDWVKAVAGTRTQLSQSVPKLK